jgi:adenylate kinase family enzyme
VAVVGSGGAGKTTFSDELGRRTGLPVIHLDRYYWRPGWVASTSAEWRALQSVFVAGDEWIIDGNYGSTFDLRLARADTVIVLAFSRWRCTARAFRRSLAHRGRDIQADGCPERIDLSFLRWVWRYPLDSRPRLDAAIAIHPGLEVIELRSPRAARAWLRPVHPDCVSGGT